MYIKKIIALEAIIFFMLLLVIVFICTNNKVLEISKLDHRINSPMFKLSTSYSNRLSESYDFISSIEHSLSDYELELDFNELYIFFDTHGLRLDSLYISNRSLEIQGSVAMHTDIQSFINHMINITGKTVNVASIEIVDSKLINLVIKVGL
jgi:hypothetical protein